METKEFKISANNFLKFDTKAYFSIDYTRFLNAGKTDFLNILKNSFYDEPIPLLASAKTAIEKIFTIAIRSIMFYNQLRSCVVVTVPRSKSEKSYSLNQTLFRESISEVAQIMPNIIDGTRAIKRNTNTRTVHLGVDGVFFPTPLGDKIPNDGPLPYPGITNETCQINKELIEGREVVLVDDIYSEESKTADDAIQALYDAGAKNVIFYAVGLKLSENKIETIPTKTLRSVSSEEARTLKAETNPTYQRRTNMGYQSRRPTPTPTPPPQYTPSRYAIVKAPARKKQKKILGMPKEKFIMVLLIGVAALVVIALLITIIIVAVKI